MRAGTRQTVLQPVRVALPGGLWRSDADAEPLREVALRAIGAADEVFVLDTANTLPPAARATALLARCLNGGEAAARALTVGDREALLLHLRRLTFGESMDCVLRCPSAACGETMELALHTSDLLLPPYAEVARSHALRVEEDAAGYELEFRLPMACDLDAAAGIALQDPERGAFELLRRCVLHAARDGTQIELDALPAQARDAVAAAMVDRDPQAELELDLSCPVCGYAFSVVFDAAVFLLQELDASAARLLRQVHVLASQYGWSEREILRMSAQRRARYIDLVAESQARASGR